MSLVILVVCADMTYHGTVIETIIDQSLTVLRAIVMFNTLKVRFLLQAEDTVLLMLRVREMTIYKEGDYQVIRVTYRDTVGTAGGYSLGTQTLRLRSNSHSV